MNKIASLLNNKITSISAEDLKGVEKIKSFCFSGCTNLQTIEFPETLQIIEGNAFENCNNLTFSLENLSPYLKVYGNVFESTKWYTSRVEGEIYLGAKGKILLPSKCTISNIPEGVINLSSYSLQAYNNELFSEIVIPDTIEIVCDQITNGHTGLTKIIVGENVKYIGSDLIPESVTPIMIFKQPKDMYVDLPQSGNYDFNIRLSGMCYSKTSRELTIYTDNLCIRNYDWSGDNVTPTFYPLSEAPI